MVFIAALYHVARRRHDVVHTPHLRTYQSVPYF